ncbi:MAG: response regulator transcription factor [Bacteroidota bacterium]
MPVKAFSPSTIFIVDDHPCIALGLSTIIDKLPAYQVLGSATTPHSAIQQIAQLKPDIIILDLDMPQINGWEVLAQSKLAGHQFLLYSHFLDYNRINKAKKQGILVGLEKSFPMQEIIKCLEAAKGGESLFLSLSIEDAPSPSTATHLDLLSRQELKIVALIAEGHSSQEIADQLFLSRRTIEWYRSRICQKLQVSGWGGLLRFATAHATQLQ